MGDIDTRFDTIPRIVGGTTRRTVFSGTGTTVYVTDGTINVPDKPVRGLNYMFRCAGTKTGTNAVHMVNLVLCGTELISVEADEATAVDWAAELTVTFVNPKVQRAAGFIASEARDCGADYAAGTIDCSAGGALRLQIEKNASDDVTVEQLSIWKWIWPGSEGSLAVTT